MLVSLFIRRLKEGKSYEDFRRAWEPGRGFGVPTRVVNAQRLDDPREILSVGFVDVLPDRWEHLGADVVANEARRHDRIAEVIEETTLHGLYQVVDDRDLS